MEGKINIAKAIVKVMAEVKGMEKNASVGAGSHSYNGTKDQDVKEVFNKALADQGLCILPIGIEEEITLSRWEEKTNYGLKQKQSVFTKVVTKYLLLHVSGESIELAGYGHGVDAQDKGAGKATTYALKNCLLYTFLTPVGKIDDTETTHSEEVPEPVRRPKISPDQLVRLLGQDNEKIKADILGLTLSDEQQKEVDSHLKGEKKTPPVKSKLTSKNFKAAMLKDDDYIKKMYDDFELTEPQKRTVELKLKIK